jgi:integrase
LVKYRTKYGDRRMYTVGKSSAITVDQARSQAEKILARITLEGFDPLKQKQSDRSALTVNDLLDTYLISAKFQEKAKSTQYTDTGRLNRHIRPLLGRVRLEQLTPDQVRKAFANIRDGKTACNVKTRPRGRARVSGGEGAARMAIRVLRAILNWAIKEGYTDRNPAEGLELGADGTRDVVLSSLSDYQTLFDALSNLRAQLQISADQADAIRLLAFTGARLNEIAALKWGQVDLTRSMLCLPRHAHKTGKKTGKGKEIALPAVALQLIARRTPGKAEEYVFPSSRGSHAHISLGSKLWARIRAEGGLPEGVTNHSLRHSLGTWMAIRGAQAPEIMAVLGHSQLSTTQKYIHMAQDARVALVERHTAEIAAALAGKAPGEVVGFPGRKAIG